MVLNLGTKLTVANAGEMKQTLLGLLQAHDAIDLDAGALVEVDVAGLQLLCATHRLATTQGKSVRFTPGERPGLGKAARTAGFADGCGDGCLCSGQGGAQ